MIQQKLTKTKTKTKIILITKTLVIFPLFTLQHDNFDHQIVQDIGYKVCSSRLLSLSQLSVYYFSANM